MKLKQWAEASGISYTTALRWFHNGTLPVQAQRVATGTILVYPDGAPTPPQQQPVSPIHLQPEGATSSTAVGELEQRLVDLYAWAREANRRIEELEAALATKP